MKLDYTDTDYSIKDENDSLFHIDKNDTFIGEALTPIPTDILTFSPYIAPPLLDNNYYYEYLSLLKNDISVNNFAKIKGSQLLLEESWLEHQTCKAVYPADNYNKILIHLFQILPDYIKNIIKNETPTIFGANFNNELGCMVDMIVRDRSYSTQNKSINITRRCFIGFNFEGSLFLIGLFWFWIIMILVHYVKKIFFSKHNS